MPQLTDSQQSPLNPNLPSVKTTVSSAERTAMGGRSSSEEKSAAPSRYTSKAKLRAALILLVILSPLAATELSKPILVPAKL